MVYTLFILIFLITSIFISAIIVTCINKSKDSASSIPKVIYQTYKNKDLIPQKVYDNIKKYAPEYKHIIYDDNECINFIKENFGDELVDLFNKYTGAHKADIFRYLILYKNGGIYLDIKIELTKPLRDIFNDDITYTILSKYSSSCMQGVIATPKNNPLFMRLINLMKNSFDEAQKNSLIFTYQIYSEIKKDIKKEIVNPGHNKNLVNNFDYYLFQEKCSRNSEDCYDGLDRYGSCCFIINKNEKIIKTRYADFPWE